MKRAFFFFAILGLLGAGAASVVACAERCQVNDPRAECNAYGAPDKYKDANVVSSSDASPE